MTLNDWFKHSGRWCQEHYAVLHNGTPVSINYIGKSEETKIKKVAKFSLHGALAYFYSYDERMEERYKIYDRLKKAIFQHTGKNYYIAQFNNDPATTFEDIKQVLKLIKK